MRPLGPRGVYPDRRGTDSTNGDISPFNHWRRSSVERRETDGLTFLPALYISYRRPFITSVGLGSIASVSDEGLIRRDHGWRFDNRRDRETLKEEKRLVEVRGALSGSRESLDQATHVSKGGLGPTTWFSSEPAVSKAQAATVRGPHLISQAHTQLSRSRTRRQLSLPLTGVRGHGERDCIVIRETREPPRIPKLRRRPATALRRSI